jgi:hypothetical protein
MKLAVSGPIHMTEVPVSKSQSFTSLRIDIDPIDLVDLHRQVLKTTGRAEFTTRDGQTTVLVCKTELDALEQALAILSDTDHVRSVRDNLARVARMCNHPLAG